LVVLEALASGLPVLASDLPTFREYLCDGENALLVNPTDEDALTEGLYQLATDDRLRDTLVQGGFPIAKKYCWQNTAIAHEHYYQEWLSQYAKPH
jgi:glycosyltransferase involved in cell wall biosynthesis